MAVYWFGKLRNGCDSKYHCTPFHALHGRLSPYFHYVYMDDVFVGMASKRTYIRTKDRWCGFHFDWDRIFGNITPHKNAFGI